MSGFKPTISLENNNDLGFVSKEQIHALTIDFLNNHNPPFPELRAILLGEGISLEDVCLVWSIELDQFLECFSFVTRDLKVCDIHINLRSNKYQEIFHSNPAVNSPEYTEFIKPAKEYFNG